MLRQALTARSHRRVDRRRCAGWLPGFDAVGDLLPRRSVELLGDGPSRLGEFEKLLAARGLGPGDQAFIDEQLQGRIDRSGTRLPHAVGALGDLLDHLVAVHGAFGEQCQDSGPDVSHDGRVRGHAPRRPRARPARSPARSRGGVRNRRADVDVGRARRTGRSRPVCDGRGRMIRMMRSWWFSCL